MRIATWKGPMPKERRRYPWREMEIGQYVSVPLDTFDAARSAAYAYARRHPGIRFTTIRTARRGYILRTR